jgi:hypothetical protein
MSEDRTNFLKVYPTKQRLADNLKKGFLEDFPERKDDPELLEFLTNLCGRLADGAGFL